MFIPLKYINPKRLIDSFDLFMANILKLDYHFMNFVVEIYSVRPLIWKLWITITVWLLIVLVYYGVIEKGKMSRKLSLTSEN